MMPIRMWFTSATVSQCFDIAADIAGNGGHHPLHAIRIATLLHHARADIRQVATWRKGVVAGRLRTNAN